MHVPDASMPIRILLANHQPIIRSGLRLLLEREPDFQIVAEAANGREASVLADYKHPAVTLLEIKLPQINGISVAKDLLSSSLPPKVIFVTAQTDVGYVVEAFKAGVHGYVAGDSAPTDLATAIRTVTRGELFVSPSICAELLSGSIDRQSMPESLSEYLRTDRCTMQNP
jgi:DNA-binding NarL/FixJ family response regulator